ncbi:MAG: CHAT domain-containing protein [Cuspidothrix sp.]
MVRSTIAVKIPLNPGVEKLPKQDNSFSNQILILFSAPLLNEDLSPVENLSIQKEIDAIASVLEDISHPIAVEIVVKVATSQTLQDVFSTRVKPLIIHFIGHGMKAEDSTALVLENEVGMTRSFSEEELEITLSNQQQVPCQLALLNACHSEKLAQAFVKAGVSHVIAVDAEDQILDVAARCFSRRLYQALFNQDEIVNAFLVSRNAVKLDDKLKTVFNSETFQPGVNFDEAFKFRLLPQSSHNQSLIIEPADSHSVIYPQWSNTNIPPDNPNFVGRRQEIHQVIKVLVESDNKRCIALHGMGGIGKTSLAYAIGQWLHERNRYKDGVWFISLRDTDSVGTLITKIKQSLELNSFALAKELKNSRVFLILDDLDRLIEKESNELIELCSFEMLSVEGQDIFPLLAFFPSGLNRDLARVIWGRSGNKALLELFKFSMAEKSPTASDWRVNLPEPARNYAESKLQKGRGIDYLAPQVLDFYHRNFCDTVLKIFSDKDNKKGRDLLLQENSNLILFLEWGYEHEMSSDKICRSARITASLSDYWRWIEANQDPLIRLNLALAAAQRNQDQVGEDLVKKTIAALSYKASLRPKSDELNLRG